MRIHDFEELTVRGQRQERRHSEGCRVGGHYVQRDTARDVAGCSGRRGRCEGGLHAPAFG